MESSHSSHSSQISYRLESPANGSFMVCSSALILLTAPGQTLLMIDKGTLINTIAGKAGEMLSGEKSRTREDIENNIRALVSSALSRLELVTRDEFDTQVAVLKHTRQRLEQLETIVEALQSHESGSLTSADESSSD